MALLELQEVEAHYRYSHVLQGVSLEVGAGEAVCLFGRNGAGKTTTLKTTMGWLKPSGGRILFAGREIGGLSPDRVCRKGIGFIPEDRRVFPTLTVEENLGLGLSQEWRLRRAQRSERLTRAYNWFPPLAERRRQLGRTLSGGEQQMLAIARTLVGTPKLLLVDEPSEGLAPLIAREIFAVMERLCRDGISILLVEQNVRAAMVLGKRCYVMEKGRIIAQGSPQALLEDEGIKQKLSV